MKKTNKHTTVEEVIIEDTILKVAYTYHPPSRSMDRDTQDDEEEVEVHNITAEPGEDLCGILHHYMEEIQNKLINRIKG